MAEEWSRWLLALAGCSGGCLGDNPGAAGECGLAAVVDSPFRPPNWRYSPIYIVMKFSGCSEDMIWWCSLSSYVSLYAFHQSYPSDNNVCIKCMYLPLYYDCAHKGLAVLVILSYVMFCIWCWCHVTIRVIRAYTVSLNAPKKPCIRKSQSYWKYSYMRFHHQHYCAFAKIDIKQSYRYWKHAFIAYIFATKQRILDNITQYFWKCLSRQS